MKILVIPIGSWGDVHPLLGIALQLRSRGHDVVFVTNGYFEPIARKAGLEFEALGTADVYRQALNDPDLWHPTRGTKKVLEWSMIELLRPTYQIIEKYHRPGETLVVSAAIGLGARLAYEKLKIPFVTTQLQPMAIYSNERPPRFPAIPEWAPPWLSRFLIRLGDVVVVNPIILPPLNAFRRELGLPPVKGKIFSEFINSPQLVLGLFPEWFAEPPSDWPPQLRLTGFPLYDEKGMTPVDPELKEFLDLGTPPVAFTPGSAMLQGLPFFTAAAEACRLLDRRGLLLTRFKENIPAQLPPGVRHFSFAPFSEVLPRCAALVHHGGIGTMAQALAAGIPQLVMPMAHDQPDNAARLRRLGVGVSIARKHFTAERVAAKLRQLLEDPLVLERARQLAKKFEGVRAIESACDHIEALGKSTAQPLAV
ncbi:MAG TPA: nucleotide disphospho-sugar-binding domain-containing protein [Planctomycetota bacterium]|nr:nucleotide disphospho-sugar-binding domain-containing protein [Planctomycetota bacterium]